MGAWCRRDGPGTEVSTDQGKSTVITGASDGIGAARLAGRIDLYDLDHDRDFSPVRAYNAAKLENVLFTRELHRRYHARGVSAVAFHPGNLATSFGTRSQSGLMRFITTSPLIRPLLTTPEKGAGQLVWPAEGRPGVDWQSGEYYEKRKPAKRVNKQARDARLAREPWERLLG